MKISNGKQLVDLLAIFFSSPDEVKIDFIKNLFSQLSPDSTRRLRNYFLKHNFVCKRIFQFEKPLPSPIDKVIAINVTKIVLKIDPHQWQQELLLLTKNIMWFMIKL